MIYCFIIKELHVDSIKKETETMGIEIRAVFFSASRTFFHGTKEEDSHYQTPCVPISYLHAHGKLFLFFF